MTNDAQQACPNRARYQSDVTQIMMHFHSERMPLWTIT
jgi:hypothetical protein